MEPGSIPTGGRPDPNEQSCRTCWFWDGERRHDLDEARTGRCAVAEQDGGLPPFFAKLLEKAAVEPVTTATDLCRCHVYHYKRSR